MLTYANKPKATQQTRAIEATKPDRVFFGQSRDVHSILHLQRTIGNQAVQRLLQAKRAEREEGSITGESSHFTHDFKQRPVPASTPIIKIQSKLEVSTPGDEFEQNADRVADEVMRMSDRDSGFSNIQRQTEEEEEEEVLSAKSETGQPPELIPEVASQIQCLRSGGQPLPSADRAFFEPRFGRDFSQVRIHTDSKAAEASQAINARAFTIGQNMVFGANEYEPGTAAGQRLLAHELTHVVQQGHSAPSASLQGMFIQREETRATETGPPAPAAPGPRRLRMPSIAEMLVEDERQRRLRRLRAMAERHLLSQVTVEVLEPRRPASCGEVMDADFRRELMSVMSESDIALIAAQPVFTVEEFMAQVEALNITLIDGQETQEEMGERIEADLRSVATGPRSGGEAAPPSFTLIELPEWLSLYSAGRIGFHVNINPGAESPLSASLAAHFRDRGLPVTSELLSELFHNRETGIASLQTLLRQILPAEFGNDIPGISTYIADELMDAALEAHVQRESPTPAERWEERDARIRQVFGGSESTELGPIQEFINNLGAGVSLTVNF